MKRHHPLLYPGAAALERAQHSPHASPATAPATPAQTTPPPRPHGGLTPRSPALGHTPRRPFLPAGCPLAATSPLQDERHPRVPNAAGARLAVPLREHTPSARSGAPVPQPCSRAHAASSVRLLPRAPVRGRLVRTSPAPGTRDAGASPVPSRSAGGNGRAKSTNPPKFQGSWGRSADGRLRGRNARPLRHRRGRRSRGTTGLRIGSRRRQRAAPQDEAPSALAAGRRAPPAPPRSPPEGAAAGPSAGSAAGGETGRSRTAANGFVAPADGGSEDRGAGGKRHGERRPRPPGTAGQTPPAPADRPDRAGPPPRMPACAPPGARPPLRGGGLGEAGGSSAGAPTYPRPPRHGPARRGAAAGKGRRGGGGGAAQAAAAAAAPGPLLAGQPRESRAPKI